ARNLVDFADESTNEKKVIKRSGDYEIYNIETAFEVFRPNLYMLKEEIEANEKIEEWCAKKKYAEADRNCILKAFASVEINPERCMKETMRKSERDKVLDEYSYLKRKGGEALKLVKENPSLISTIVGATKNSGLKTLDITIEAVRKRANAIDAKYGYGYNGSAVFLWLDPEKMTDVFAVKAIEAVYSNLGKKDTKETIEKKAEYTYEVYCKSMEEYNAKKNRMADWSENFVNKYVEGNMLKQIVALTTEWGINEKEKGIEKGWEYKAEALKLASIIVEKTFGNYLIPKLNFALLSTNAEIYKLDFNGEFGEAKPIKTIQKAEKVYESVEALVKSGITYTALMLKDRINVKYDPNLPTQMANGFGEAYKAMEEKISEVKENSKESVNGEELKQVVINVMWSISKGEEEKEAGETERIKIGEKASSDYYGADWKKAVSGFADAMQEGKSLDEAAETIRTNKKVYRGKSDELAFIVMQGYDAITKAREARANKAELTEEKLKEYETSERVNGVPERLGSMSKIGIINKGSAEDVVEAKTNETVLIALNLIISSSNPKAKLEGIEVLGKEGNAVDIENRIYTKEGQREMERRAMQWLMENRRVDTKKLDIELDYARFQKMNKLECDASLDEWHRAGTPIYLGLENVNNVQMWTSTPPVKSSFSQISMGSADVYLVDYKLGTLAMKDADASKIESYVNRARISPTNFGSVMNGKASVEVPAEGKLGEYVVLSRVGRENVMDKLRSKIDAGMKLKTYERKFKVVDDETLEKTLSVYKDKDEWIAKKITITKPEISAKIEERSATEGSPIDIEGKIYYTENVDRFRAPQELAALKFKIATLGEMGAVKRGEKWYVTIDKAEHEVEVSEAKYDKKNNQYIYSFAIRDVVFIGRGKKGIEVDANVKDSFGVIVNSKETGAIEIAGVPVFSENAGSETKQTDVAEISWIGGRVAIPPHFGDIASFNAAFNAVTGYIQETEGLNKLKEEGLVTDESAYNKIWNLKKNVGETILNELKKNKVLVETDLVGGSWSDFENAMKEFDVPRIKEMLKPNSQLRTQFFDRITVEGLNKLTIKSSNYWTVPIQMSWLPLKKGYVDVPFTKGQLQLTAIIFGKKNRYETVITDDPEKVVAERKKLGESYIGGFTVRMAYVGGALTVTYAEDEFLSAQYATGLGDTSALVNSLCKLKLREMVASFNKLGYQSVDGNVVAELSNRIATKKKRSPWGKGATCALYEGMIYEKQGERKGELMPSSELEVAWDLGDIGKGIQVKLFGSATAEMPKGRSAELGVAGTVALSWENQTVIMKVKWDEEDRASFNVGYDINLAPMWQWLGAIKKNGE
ncbi:MAG: hypothetical protein ABIH99_00245, partial [Candidatus Micrarchaeota archaeon]